VDDRGRGRAGQRGYAPRRRRAVADARIAELLAGSGSAKEACAGLVDAALADGGSDNIDNIIVVVTRWLS
jgi:serine/threonine protein phosphatase PrpC